MSNNALAAPLTFTDRSAFDAAVSGQTVSALNFDNIAAGTTYASGTGTGGVSFTYNLGGVMLGVTDGAAFGNSGPFATTSGSNFLGTDDLDMFQGGDKFSMHFAGAHAIGLYLLSLDPLFNSDFMLTVGTTAASLVTADLQQTLIDGTNVYFLGLFDGATSFTDATLTSASGGNFLWNADDIVLARSSNSVPEPGSLTLIPLALAALATTQFNRRKLPC